MSKNSSIEETIGRLGPAFAKRADAHDRDDSFVSENYRELKEAGFFSAGIPSDLGGGGADHAELCDGLCELARYCSSTALAVSMHSHLIAALVWRWRHGQPAEAVLKRIAEKQLVLVSTGAADWLGSNGRVERIGEDYRVTARKPFASGCPAGDMLITSACYDDPEEGPLVLHFGVPLNAEGVSIEENWVAHGMRGTGSHDVTLQDVHFAEASITLRRPRDQWHPFWAVVLTVALPLIISVYLGIAEKAADQARRDLPERRKDDPSLPYLFGEMENQLTISRLAVRESIENCANYDFEPDLDRARRALVCKTLVAESAQRVVAKAMEIAAAGGYYRSAGLERLLRDVRAAHYHPLPEKAQLRFVGRLALGLDPIGDSRT